jgi:hypothetical protein
MPNFFQVVREPKYQEIGVSWKYFNNIERKRAEATYSHVLAYLGC